MNRYGSLHKSLAVTLGGATLVFAAELRAEWTEVATLAPPLELGGDGATFGQRAVACDGGTTLVGAHGEDDYAGAVYAFSGPDFSEAQRLTAPDSNAFGGSLAISGDTAIIGSTLIDDASVWLFSRQDGVWAHRQTIVATGDARYGAFGSKVALHGDIAVVTAPKEAGDRGRIHVFRRAGNLWAEEAVLTASDGQDNDFFGLGFGFDGATLIAGAPTNPIDDAPRGAAYIFARDGGGTWSHEARFDLAGREPTSPEIYFGGAASIDGDWAVVSGAAGTDVPVEPRVYVYQRDGGVWQPFQTILLPGGENLGASSAVRGDRIFIQSVSGDTRSVHEYQRAGGEWLETQALPALTASGGFAVCGALASTE